MQNVQHSVKNQETHEGTKKCDSWSRRKEAIEGNPAMNQSLELLERDILIVKITILKD